MECPKCKSLSVSKTETEPFFIVPTAKSFFLFVISVEKIIKPKMIPMPLTFVMSAEIKLVLFLQ